MIGNNGVTKGDRDVEGVKIKMDGGFFCRKQLYMGLYKTPNKALSLSLSL